jgi:hypothetical protein
VTERTPRAARCLSIGLSILFVGSLSVRAQNAQRQTGLCDVDEGSYFSCKTSHGKWISLCGRDDGPVQYRFGERGKIELRFPSSKRPQETLRYAHYFRFQVDRFEVTFDTDGVRYSVFDYSEGEQNRAGVSIARAGARNVVVKCAGAVQSRWNELEPRLPCDVDNALNLGSCPEVPSR